MRSRSRAPALAPILVTVALSALGAAACAEEQGDDPPPAESPAPEPAPETVWPLAKADQWRDGLVESLGEQPFALLEVAFDRSTADRAWRDNVPEDLAPASGPPPAGVYDELDTVDFGTHAVVVWSSGESGSCPAWLADVSLDADGVVHAETGNVGGEGAICTDDFRPYTMLVAVARDQLPDRADLPADTVMVDGRDVAGPSIIRAYPAD